ncbi:MAG: alpha/beta fold hydrolase [Acidimicrobiia bacterium]|nr:alpha/beta fold hydrolase [Acidimicrobiia bacterium]NNL98662.1 alpha/beta fold hydrolase [Acidimicrobiia bacterium]
MNILTAPFVLARRALKVAPVAAAAGVAYSAVAVDHDLPLPSPLAAEPSFVALPGSRTVALYQRGPDEAPPVLLVHSVNAAASAAEMRPLFDELSADLAVTALDLPGYGKSEREPIEYDVATMTAGVVAALEHVGRPAHVVALSLGAEFAARAENLRPDLVASLTLISPTGFRSTDSSPPEWLGDLVRMPVVGQAVFDALTSRPSIHYFLSRSFTGEVDAGLESYAYLTAHQPNARYAPASFLAGTLFTRNATGTLYSQVAAPTQVLFDEDAYSSFDELAPFTSQHAGWTARRIPDTRGLPQFDATGETVKAIREFIQNLPG